MHWHIGLGSCYDMGQGHDHKFTDEEKFATLVTYLLRHRDVPAWRHPQSWSTAVKMERIVYGCYSPPEELGRSREDKIDRPQQGMPEGE